VLCSVRGDLKLKFVKTPARHGGSGVCEAAELAAGHEFLIAGDEERAANPRAGVPTNSEPWSFRGPDSGGRSLQKGMVKNHNELERNLHGQTLVTTSSTSGGRATTGNFASGNPYELPDVTGHADRYVGPKRGGRTRFAGAY